MHELSRRDALKVAAASGALAIIGPGEASPPASAPVLPATSTQPAGEMDAAQEQADRARVIACGLTDEEADCWELTAKAAGKFFDLPQLHVMDAHEVAQAIHIIQYKLLSRPVYRKYLESAKAAAGK